MYIARSSISPLSEIFIVHVSTHVLWIFRVLEAAAARQGRVSLSAKQALRRMSLGNTTSSLPGGGNSSAIKRKLKAAGGNLALFGGGGGNGGGAGGPGPSDVLPVGLLRDSLKVPKMR